MTATPSDPQRPQSVFAKVNQKAIVAKIEQTTADDDNSTFFDESLRSESHNAARTFNAGVQALVGQAPGNSSRSPVHVARPRERVTFTEAVPTGRDARNAFILRGPAGVSR